MFDRLLKKLSPSAADDLRDRLGEYPIASHVEVLEERIVLSGNGLIDMNGIPVQGGYDPTGTLLHKFKVTSVTGDSNNDGIVSQANLTLRVELQGPFAPFHQDTLVRVIDDQNNVIGQVDDTVILNGLPDPMTSTVSTFDIPITLQQTSTQPTGEPQTFRIEVERTTPGQQATLDVKILNAAGTAPTTSNLLGMFTLDTVNPVVQSFNGVPAAPTSTPVTSVTVNFSEDVTGFDSADITLRRDGVIVDTSFTVQPMVGPANSYVITGLETSQDGDYELIINQAGVMDIAGNTGTGTQSATWTQDTMPPAFTDAPILAPADDVGPDESGLNLPGIPPGSTIKVTNLASVMDGFMVTGMMVPSDVTSIEISVRDLMDNDLLTAPVAASISGGSYSATINNADFAMPPFAPGFGTDTFQVVATAFDAAANSSTTTPLFLVVDNEEPAAPTVQLTGQFDTINGALLTTETNPTFTFPVDPANEDNATIIVERADGNTPTNFQQVGMPLVPAINSRIMSFTDTTLATEGTHIYRFKQVDLALNDPPTVLTLVVDTMPPMISNLLVDGVAPQAGMPLVDVTQPTFTFDVSDQQYAALDNDLLVELVDQNSNVLASTLLSNPAGMDGVFQQQNVTLSPTMPLGVGQHSLMVRVTDQDLAALDAAAAIVQSTPVAVTITSADTPGAPGTPVFADIYDMRTIGTLPGGTGGDVLLENGTRVDFTGAHVWQTSFDKTTQTVWINLEHGLNNDPNRGPNDPLVNNGFGTIQFDPATGQFKLFDYRTIFGDDAVVFPNNDPATDFRNPHGNFFDFDTHVNPRIWIAHRNPVLGTGPGQTGGDGRISYIEVRPDANGMHRVVTYDIANLAGVDLTDFHAAFVDTRGNVWVTASDESSILEIDFDVQSGPAESANIDSTSALVKVHEMPAGLLTGEATTGDHSDFHGHALKVAVDDRTGEQYAWIASVGERQVGARGQIALLRPGAGASGEDVWTTWDIPLGSLDAQRARVPFVDIDDNETPGDPSDDRIIFVAPVPLGEGVATGQTIGIVQVFEPGIRPDDPMGQGNGRLRTYQVHGLTTEFAATNQPFVDREGGIYWIDRLTGIGRIDPDAAIEIVDNNMVAPRHLTSDLHDAFFIAPTDNTSDANPNLVTPVVGYAALDISAPFRNEGIDPGVNQYRISGSNPQMGTGGTGDGPFRAAINAGNVLYGAHAKQDEISATVFAETTRRQVSVVRTSDALAAGTLVEGRMAFQVIRTATDPMTQAQTGAVIMTFRNDGVILDQQVNLTALVAAQAGMNAADIGIDGDVEAVRDAAGNVYVVGKADSGALDVIAYRLDSGTGQWSLMTFGDGNQVLPADITPVLDAAGQLAVLATDSNGHLQLFQGGGAPTDLTNVDVVANPELAVYGNLADIENLTDGTLSIYGVNQQGGFVEYILNADLTLASGPVVQIVNPVPMMSDRDVRVLQALYVADHNGQRQLFGVDGTSRMVHMQRDEMTGEWSAINVSQTIVNTGQSTGYFNFQSEFAARVYAGLDVVSDADTGDLFVYGTNGGDLVEFKFSGGTWTAANLTNDLTRGTGQRTAANNVFGAPEVYLGERGERHVLQINAEGEVVEYVLERDGTFTTQNVNLALGNAVQDLRRFDSVPVLQLPGGPALFAQNGAAAPLDPAALLTGNVAAFGGGTIIIRIADWQMGDSLSLNPMAIGTPGVISDGGAAVGTFSVSPNGAKLTLDFDATTTKENVDSVLRMVKFQTTAAAANLGSRLVEFSVQDDSGNTQSSTAKAVAVLSEGMLDDPFDGEILS